MAKKWSEVRAKAIQEGRLNEHELKEGKDRLLAEVRAHRLAELRDDHGLRQEDLSKLPKIT